MAAHSACDFGGGKAEKLALAKYRQVIWQGRVLNSQFSDEELRNHGRCPLTPEEIGLLLAALGFSNSTRLYLASHKVILHKNWFCCCRYIKSDSKLIIWSNQLLLVKWETFFSWDLKSLLVTFFFLSQVYGGEARISTLRKLFPLMEDKKSLVSTEERAQVEGRASLLAAVDYYVSMQSDIFISASPGNMHNALVSISI